MLKNKKTIGVIGGMGPEATVDFFRWVVHLTTARSDIDHPHLLIDNNPQIPSRIKAILDHGPSPLPVMLRMAQKLVLSGAKIIVIPCNTASYFIPSLQKKINVPILNIIEETVFWINNHYPNIKKVGIMATIPTLKTGLYQQELIKFKIEPIVPTLNIVRKLIMSATHGRRGIKSGYHSTPRRKLIKSLKYYRQLGAEAIILGCTEIPLVLRPKDSSLILINPTKILAQAVISRAI
ncbi:amino acid racemase [Candidatus Shapirobacteria bacterium]|nr:amino acid racemase [Candidatus Shapirobacteria bacterium]